MESKESGYKLSELTAGMILGGVSYLKDFFKITQPVDYMDVMESCILSGNFNCMKYWFDEYYHKFEYGILFLVFPYDNCEFFRYCHEKINFECDLVYHIVADGAIDCLKYWHSLGNKITQRVLDLAATTYLTLMYCYEHGDPGCGIQESTMVYSLYDLRSFKYCLSKGGIVTKKITNMINKDPDFKEIKMWYR